MKCPYCIKVCSKCGKLLVANNMNFNKTDSGKYKLRSYCKICQRKKGKEYRKKNKTNEKNYIVYMHISPNNKKYIGMTSQKSHRRWAKGKGYVGTYFNKDIEKYGWDNFQHIVIVKGLNEDEAEWLEKELIKIWDTTNKEKGYNIYTGGLSGYRYTEERKNEISNRTKGENNPMYGKHHSEEAIKKIKEANIGKHLSEEHKKKISKKTKGENNPMYGRDRTGKNSGSGKSVICLTTKRIFYTSKDGAMYYKTDNSSIGKCCKGKYKSSGKFNGLPLIWRYLIWKHNKRYRIKNK